MALESCGQSEHPDHVYTDAGELCVGGESCRKIGEGRLERLGVVSSYGMFTRVLVGDGAMV